MTEDLTKKKSLIVLGEQNLKENLLPYYGLGHCYINQVKLKDTDKQRAVYRVDDGDKSYCLKKVYYNHSQLLFVYSSLEWLYRYDINVPKLLPTISNGRYVEYEDMLFILTPWIEGVKCSYDNQKHIVASAENLGKMHKVSTCFNPIQGSSNNAHLGSIYHSLEKHYQNIIDCYNQALIAKDKFSKLFLEHFETNMKLAKTSLEAAYTINNKNLSVSLCHLDYVNKNIIFENNDKLWVIDFDKCAIDYCAHDIGYFLRRLLKRDNTNWDVSTALAAINSYEIHNNLSMDDLKYIFSYLCFPQKYWKISRDYFNNITKCNKNSFYNLLLKAVQKEHSQLSFAKEFKKVLRYKYALRLSSW